MNKYRPLGSPTNKAGAFSAPSQSKPSNEYSRELSTFCCRTDLSLVLPSPPLSSPRHFRKNVRSLEGKPFPPSIRSEARSSAFFGPVEDGKRRTTTRTFRTPADNSAYRRFRRQQRSLRALACSGSSLVPVDEHEAPLIMPAASRQIQSWTQESRRWTAWLSLCGVPPSHLRARKKDGPIQTMSNGKSTTPAA